MLWASLQDQNVVINRQYLSNLWFWEHYLILPAQLRSTCKKGLRIQARNIASSVLDMQYLGLVRHKEVIEIVDIELGQTDLLRRVGFQAVP